MKRREIHQLIDSLMDGEITEADFLRLEAELSIDGEARQDYYDRVTLAMLLESEAMAISANIPSQERAVAPTVTTSVRRWTILSLVTAASICVAVVWWAIARETNDRSVIDTDRKIALADEEQASGFAVIIGQAEAVWESGSEWANGTLLPTGELHLLSGAVQLELFSGVSVVVEGEADFTLISSMDMIVRSGKVRAHVPEPAHGFRIQTRDGEIIDLGTDFAVNVTDDRSEVHVLEGEVQLQPRSGDSRRMAGGQAVSLSNNGEKTELAADTTKFLGVRELRSQLQHAQQSKRERWQQHSESLRRDPRLVALYQVGLSNRWDRRLPNRATGKNANTGEGAVVAAGRTVDRWQQSGGTLDFSPTGSRVRLSIPGEYRSLTLLCWVKINSLDRWYNSLFLTDGHDQHEPHWQIMDDGRLFFSVKKRDQWDTSKGEKDKHIYYSPPFWNTSLNGQWLMIATVYDVDNRQVIHFVNGEVLCEEAIPEEYLVESIRIGNASLCNWGQPERNEPRFAVRNLNGSLDEFAMFNAALTPTEIRELYDNGKP